MTDKFVHIDINNLKSEESVNKYLVLMKNNLEKKMSKIGMKYDEKEGFTLSEPSPGHKKKYFFEENARDIINLFEMNSIKCDQINKLFWDDKTIQTKVDEETKKYCRMKIRCELFLVMRCDPHNKLHTYDFLSELLDTTDKVRIFFKRIAADCLKNKESQYLHNINVDDDKNIIALCAQRLDKKECVVIFYDIFVVFLESKRRVFQSRLQPPYDFKYPTPLPNYNVVKGEIVNYFYTLLEHVDNLEIPSYHRHLLYDLIKYEKEQTITGRNPTPSFKRCNIPIEKCILKHMAESIGE